MKTSRIALVLLAAALAGCQSAYYATMEKFGTHKRDILVSRVTDARDGQQEASEQFRSALDRFSEIVAFDGGDLRELYDRLDDELEASRDKAEEVRGHIADVESVAEALFEEWEDELEQYSSADLRRRSAEKLDATRSSYDQLIAAMHRAESKMEPVLVAFNDQVLFLKHNLNAQAVASLQGNVAALESEIASLITEMEAAIAEADSFIRSMGVAGARPGESARTTAA